MMNKEIRSKAAGAGVPLWRIADALGITDSTFSRKLRRELPPDEQKHIFSIIDSLKEREAE